MTNSPQGDQTALAPPPTPLPLVGGEVTRASDLFSPALWRLLTDGTIEWREAARRIAFGANLRAECAANAPVLAQRAAPADRMELAEYLARQRVVFGIPDQSEELNAAMMAPYYTALERVPLEAVKEAFARWNRGEAYPKEPGRQAFYPRPAEVYKLAEPTMLALSMAAYRAGRALEQTEKERGSMSQDERAVQRAEAIRLGILNPDGTVNLGGLKPLPAAPADDDEVI